jgi:hypothetical protein
MSNIHTSADETPITPWTTQVAPRRKTPKSDDQLLADTEKRIGLLRKKVLATRDKQRLELVDDLYVKYGVKAVANDMSERKRLTSLREKLGLTG